MPVLYYSMEVSTALVGAREKIPVLLFSAAAIGKSPTHALTSKLATFTIVLGAVEPLQCGDIGDLVRCPHFRVNIKKAYSRHSKVSLIQRCPYFRGIIKRGSTVYTYPFFLQMCTFFH